MAGTAATDAGFLLVEHPGPWGNKAFAESRLVPEHVKAAVTAAAAEHRVRVQLIRRPAERGSDRATYRVFLAHPASHRLDVVEVADLAELADLDLGLARCGPRWQPYAGALLLICTNGRRDVCCAEFGGPVAREVARALPEETWETTHLGGHRFAVAALTLPDGMSYGRVDAAAGIAVGQAARSGEVVPAYLRGFTGFPPAVQAAEVALRLELGLTARDAVRLVATDDTASGHEVRFVTGLGEYVVAVVAVAEPPARQSCGDLVEKPSTTWRVESIRARGGSAPGAR